MKQYTWLKDVSWYVKNVISKQHWENFGSLKLHFTFKQNDLKMHGPVDTKRWICSKKWEILKELLKATFYLELFVEMRKRMKAQAQQW